MRATVYLETTIPSLLAARLSRDPEISAQQLATRKWWYDHRSRFELCISQEVLKEAGRGDAEAARRRLSLLAECSILAVTDLAEVVGERLLRSGAIPRRAASDAVHIAYAVAHESDFLLTWNCRHIMNQAAERKVAEICNSMGLVMPAVCTPRRTYGTMPTSVKTDNPIEEVWRIRDELSAEFGYDVRRIFASLREEEKVHGGRLVYPHSKPLEAGDVPVVRDEPPKDR